MAANKCALHNRRRGQSLVEFALAIPFVVLVIVAIMYFGRVFYIKQVVLLATQEAARDLSRMPGEILDDPTLRESRIGFTTTGAQTEPNSVAGGILGAANLLSAGNTGDLPPGSQVNVYYYPNNLPPDGILPVGSIKVRISYPFKFINNPFGTTSTEFGNSVDVWTGEDGDPVKFEDFSIIEQTVFVKEIQ
ncbi:MAG: pilus assembly protein [Candidatus Obscuribacterales bacterium]|nr:pilus assembly protein [Candidatus Obscuribacterales bacterium]